MRTLTDIALEQERLEKSFKYIRREWRNGRWRYWYEEPKHTDKEALKGGFGEKWKGYKGKPREAFEKLLKEQKKEILQNILTGIMTEVIL